VTFSASWRMVELGPSMVASCGSNSRHAAIGGGANFFNAVSENSVSGPAMARDASGSPLSGSSSGAAIPLTP